MLIMAKNVIVVGADNHPPMLDKSEYSSWQSRMILYIKGKENGKQLYDSVINGPFKYATVVVPETPTTPASVRDRTYDDLTELEKIHESYNIRETNIVLQGLPQDIYNMVNHHTEAMEIWDRVKLLIEVSELSLQERESKLYDEFVTFTSEKGETIHCKFVTDVKLAQDLHNTNFDHLYAYLRQHEAHANEVRLMRQRYPDPLALVANTYNPSPSYTYQTQYHQQLSLIAQQYYSPPAQQPTNDVPMTVQGRPAQGHALVQGVMLQEHELTEMGELIQQHPQLVQFLWLSFTAYDSDILSKVPNPDTYQTNNVIDQSVQEMQYSEQPPFINDFVIDITNSNVISYEQYLQEIENEVAQDTNSSAQQDAMIMYVIEEMSNQVAKCNEVNKENKIVNESLTVEVERYKEQIKFFEERQKVDLTDREKYIDSQICRHDALSVMDNEERLTLAEESRLKMHAKQNDKIAKDKNVNIAPIDYAALNKLSEHFAKHFLP
ncbi:hypothetical protein Tco_0243158 [Tanacetum coccineum]